MKVLLLIPHVADGGAEKVLSQLSLGLKADEIVVTVFENRVDYPIRGKLICMDLPIGRGLIKRLIGFGRRIVRFRKVLRTEHPDVVVSFMGEANILNALLSRRPVLTVHNHLTSLGKFARGKAETGISEWLIRTLYRRATVVAVSNAVKHEMIDVFHVPPERVVVIPNSVNKVKIQTRANEPAEIPWDSSIPVIITAGRLTQQKGQWHLIEAFAKVRKKMPCQLAILGSGELEGRLRDVAQKAGVEGDVHFLGRQANPWKFMARASVFVLPSLTEGFGLVMLEAMACSLPVISTDCPGAARDILDPSLGLGTKVEKAKYGDYGVLVPVGDDSELAEAVERLLRSDELSRRYVESGLKRVMDFDQSIFLDRYQRLIDSVRSHPL